MKILALNAGSSTLKYALFEDLQLLDRDIVEGVGSLPAVLSEVDAVGSRVVHGGDKFKQATRVTPEVIAGIRELGALAPLHNPRDADLLSSVLDARPGLPVVAVFDTSFHQTLPALASTYAIPSKLGVRRYGFHGISYRYIVGRLEKELGHRLGKFVLCHLGNGSSVCAIRDGVSVDTSMGLTPLEGLVMGTRSGDIDPGIVEYLVRTAGMSLEQIDSMLNHESGLLGVSGKSGDVRKLEELAGQGDEVAEFALDLFAYRVAKYVGGYAVVLDGLDGLVFSGGIGEHSADVRARICARLGSLGVSISEPDEISDEVTCLSASVRPGVWVVKTDEERQIAVETAELLRTSP